MPRNARWFHPGLALHVLQRGNDRIACFRTVEDRRCYLGWLDEHAREFDCRLHAYVLMTNHVHLLLTPGSHDGPSRLMQALGRRYVRYFNDKHKRTGTLWEGRFKAHPVQSDDHVLCLYRYIELNPVRAGMVVHPGSYRWSSYARNALGGTDVLLTGHSTYDALAKSGEERQAAYRALSNEELGQETLKAIRSATSSGRPWGSSTFRESLSRDLALPLGGRNGRPRKADNHAGASVVD